MYAPGRDLESPDCQGTRATPRRPQFLSFTATCTVNVKLLNPTKHRQSATFLNLVETRRRQGELLTRRQQQGELARTQQQQQGELRDADPCSRCL